MTNNLAADILSGNYDESLHTIQTAVKERLAALYRATAMELEPGDTVHFSPAIHPRYLVGLSATVVRVNQESVTVNCPDEPRYRKYTGAHGVRCPNAYIQELVAV